MNFAQQVAWTKNHLAGLAVGGVWLIPRSGLTFCRSGEAELTLIDAMPFEAFGGQQGEGIPESKAKLVEWQTIDFRSISERAIAAGYKVLSEVRDIQPITFNL